MAKRLNKRDYVMAALATGRDPEGVLGVDTVKVKTYRVKLDGFVWVAWKTHGRAWQEPEDAPRPLREAMKREVTLKSAKVSDTSTVGEVEVASPYTKMAMFKRTRAAAEAWLREHKN